MKLTTPYSISSDQQQAIAEETARMRAALSDRYDSSYASLYAPFDLEVLEQVQELAQQKHALLPHAIVVVGIGGSNLGTMAIAQAKYGVLYNEAALRPKIYFVDTVDPDYTAQVLNHVEELLQYGDNIILNVVTKSGTTAETLANFQLFYEVIKEHRPDTYSDYIVVTTDEGSPLDVAARSENLAVLTVPPTVGGRYSVFSVVGLFPLALLHVNVTRLLEGARAMIESSVDEDINSNIPAQTAAFIVDELGHGKTIHDEFLFAKELAHCGAWYRQLIGESLGKQGKGITPTYSVGSIDLHSVAQLTLGGPNDKSTTFVRVQHFNNLLTVPETPFSPLVPKLTDKSYQTIMDAIVDGTQQAYEANERSFVSLTIEQVDEYEVGQLLQMQMIQIMLIGKLMGIDPFDQPNVEEYKSRTRDILEQ